MFYERWNNPVILKSDPLSLDDSDEVQSVVLEKVPTLEEELTVMKETDEENKNSIKDPMMVNDVPLKWRTESNEETTEEEEFDERLVIRWLREKKIKLITLLLSRFIPKEEKLPDLFFKERENVREFDAFIRQFNTIQDSSILLFRHFLIFDSRV